MAKSLHVEMVFFKGDEFLCRDSILIGDKREERTISGGGPQSFCVSYVYGEPACPIFIRCFEGGKVVSRSAMSVGVHDSDDWEAISLADPFELCFRCSVCGQ